MGKQRFRLSHMIPNAWFYRLRDMNTTPNNLSATNNHPRSSFCYTPKVYSSPSNRNTINVPKHVLGSIYIRPTHDSTHTDQDLFLSPSSSCYESPLFESTPPLDRPSSTTTCGCGVIASSTKRVQDSSGYELVQKPPLIRTKYNMDTSTKPKENNQENIKIVKDSIPENNNNPRKKILVSGSNSSNKVIVDENSFPSSCCIVKSTFDPCKDLKESMLEMIVDSNIREPKDLEKLLAYYLTLNSDEYHDVIVKAFEETWLTFDF